MSTAAAMTYRDHTVARWLLGVLVGVGAIGALLVIVTGPTPAEALFVLAGLAIGIVAALSFARAVEAEGASARAIWIARGFGLLGAAIAVWFPAILFGELRYGAAPGQYNPSALVLREIELAVLVLPVRLVPIVIAMRMPVAGGALFVVLAAIELVQGAFDPTGSFPERSVGPSMWIGLVPPLLVGLTLIVAGLAQRRRPHEPPFAAWLRDVVPFGR